jgi:hypothetical protein
MLIVGCGYLLFFPLLIRYIQPLSCCIGSLAYWTPLLYFITENVTVNETFGFIVRLISLGLFYMFLYTAFSF